MTTLLIRNVVVRRRSGLDVRVGPHAVLAVKAGLRPVPGEQVIDGQGAALIPGLHDHHVHLRAVVAARQSVNISAVATPAEFDRIVAAATTAAAPPDWVRIVGWHEPSAGSLDRSRLDALAGPIPVRVQHRSGAMWVLNSAALHQVGAAAYEHPGVERDEGGEPTGRLLRLDGWLRERLPSHGRRNWFATGLARYAADCLRLGITGWTDATPERDPGDVAEFTRLAAAGAFSQLLVLMAAARRPTGETGARADTGGNGRVALGPVKVMLDDVVLPSPAELAAIISAAHRAGSAAAIHCVTAEQLVVAVAAAEQAGPPNQTAAGPDRIEHAGIVPPGYANQLARLGLAVVTQPGFIAARGDAYRRELSPAEQDWLYPAASLLRSGVTVAAGTDAPFGPNDPWQCIAAAVTRQTPDGRPLGPAERLSARTALKLFLADPSDVRQTRSIMPGQPSDLCLLNGTLLQALASAPGAAVRAVISGGQPYWHCASDGV